MVLSLPKLPDEILGVILRQLDSKSLRHASLVSSRWHKLVQPVLFHGIDLARRDAGEGEALYSHLLGPRGDNEYGSLKEQHVHTLEYSFNEECLDKAELNSKLDATRNVFQALGGVSILELELILSEDSSPAFEKILLPAIQSFFQYARGKVMTLKLTIETGHSMAYMKYEKDSLSECVAQKLSEFFALVPSGIITSLQLVNVAVASLPPALNEILASSALKSLSLQDCNQGFHLLPTIPQLQDLTMTWGVQSENQSALQAAYNIIKDSATTARSFTLHNICPRNIPLHQGWSSALTLPQLTRLHLSDSHVGPNSLFDRILSHTSVPLLRTLVLEMEDIFEGAQIIWESLENFPHLHNLKLMQSGDKREVGTTPIDSDYFKMLETRCAERQVILEAVVWVRCNTPDQLAHEYKRLAIFGNSITDISINCRTGSLEGIEQLPPLLFSKVLQMSVVLSDISVLGFSDSAAAEEMKADDLKALFGRLACPKLETLRIMLFVNNARTTGGYADIEQVLYECMYPSLEVLAGGLIASPGVPTEHFQTIQHKLEAACHVAGVDCSRLAYISHDVLDDDDDSINTAQVCDVDAEAAQLNASMQDAVSSRERAKSDSCDSGYAVDLGSSSPLREARPVIGGILDALSDYCMLDEGPKSAISSSSDSSWLMTRMKH